MIQKKLLELQKQGVSVKKNADNPFFKSKYMTLDGILEVYNPKLSEQLLVVYHQSKDGQLTTTLHDTEDASELTTSFPLATWNPQQIGSSITYAKRYNLSQLLNIVTDEDDDGNKASTGDGEKPKEKVEKPRFNDENLAKLEAVKDKYTAKNVMYHVGQGYKVNKEMSQKILSLYS